MYAFLFTFQVCPVDIPSEGTFVFNSQERQHWIRRYICIGHCKPRVALLVGVPLIRWQSWEPLLSKWYGIHE
jgi:hypothetical protein